METIRIDVFCRKCKKHIGTYINYSDRILFDGLDAFRSDVEKSHQRHNWECEDSGSFWKEVKEKEENKN